MIERSEISKFYLTANFLEATCKTNKKKNTYIHTNYGDCTIM